MTTRWRPSWAVRRSSACRFSFRPTASRTAATLSTALADEYLALELGGELVDDGGDHAAGAAPLSPEVDDDGLVLRSACSTPRTTFPAVSSPKAIRSAFLRR